MDQELSRGHIVRAPTSAPLFSPCSEQAFLQYCIQRSVALLSSFQTAKVVRSRVHARRKYVVIISFSSLFFPHGYLVVNQHYYLVVYTGVGVKSTFTKQALLYFLLLNFLCYMTFLAIL